MNDTIKKLEKLESRAERLADTIDRCRQELEDIMWEAEEACEAFDDPNAQKILERIKTMQYEVEGISFDPYTISKKDVDERAARIVEAQYALAKLEEAKQCKQYAAEALEGMHVILSAVATWRRDEAGKYTVVTR